MRLLVPPFILERLADGAYSGTLDAAVLLIDGVGSTAIAADLQKAGVAGDEVLAQVLWDVFSPQIAAIRAHGGFVGGFAGDGFVALFPGSAADALGRAAEAAIDIRHHMETAATHVHEFGTTEFEVKAVLTYGPATWHIWRDETINSGQSHAYTFSGLAVREAHAAETDAARGVVLLTDSARAHLPDTAVIRQSDGWVLDVAADRHPATGHAPPASPDLEGAELFYPPFLQHTNVRGEFRSVVSAFVQLREPAEVDSPDSPMSRLLRLTAERGGFVCDINQPGVTDTGMTMLTLWGAPTAYENTIERAVSFLLQARDVIGPDNMKAAATIDTLYAGFVGSDDQAAYTCIGSGVNLAARILGESDWGDVWVDGALSALLADEVQASTVGQRTFRGFDDSTTVTALLGKGDVEITSFYPGAFVGRAAETEALVGWLDAIREGRDSGAIVVTGEAGSGKSRLLHELQDQIGVEARWMVGHTDPIGRAPMNPIAYLIRRGMNIHLEDSPAEMRRKVDERLAAMIDLSVEPLRADLVNSRAPVLSTIDALEADDPFNGLSAQLQFERIIESIVAILAFDAANRFVVVHLEDAHWLDEATTDILRRVMDRIEHLPIAVVVTSRQPVDEAWVAHSLHLDVLDRASIAEHAASLIEDVPAPDLVDLLEARTGGNPYYVGQIVAFMLAEDLLKETPDGLSPRYAGARVPVDLQAVLISRIDQLAEEVRLAVQHAAVLGREFDLQILLRMLGDSAAMRHVDEAERAQVWTALSEIRYLFRHALMRDAAYGMQLRSTLTALHGAAADAIEFLAAGEPERHASSLAFHLDRAERARDAAHWYSVAGEQARAQFANRDAIERFGRALDLTPADDVSERFRLLRSLEGVYRFVGDSDGHDRALAQLVDLVPDLEPRQRLEVRHAQLQAFSQAGQYDQVMSVGSPAAHEAEEVDALDLACTIRHTLAHASRATGSYDDAVSHAESARDLAERAGDEALTAASLDLLGGISYDRGDYETAASLHGQAVERMAEAQDQVGEIRALNNLGTAVWGLGDFSEAARVHRRGADRSRSIGYRLAEGDNLDNLGGARWAVGALTEAITYYREALQIRRHTRDMWGVGISLGNLGNAYRNADRCLEAIECFNEALEVDRAIGRKRGEGYSLHGLGWAYLGCSRPSDARTSFAAAVKTRTELGETANTTESMAGLAAALAELGDKETAVAQVRDVIERFDDEFRSSATEPFLAYRTCIDLIQDSDPETAASLEADALVGLRARLERISDLADRDRYEATVVKHTAFTLD